VFEKKVPRGTFGPKLEKGEETEERRGGWRKKSRLEKGEEAGERTGGWRKKRRLEKGEEAGKNCIMRSIMICSLQILIRRSNHVERIVIVIVTSKISLTKIKKHTEI
jgi:hypothetical protein